MTNENNYSFSLDLPGFSKDEVTLTVEPLNTATYLRIEAKNHKRRYSDTFLLNRVYDHSKLTAKLEHGVLTVNVPRVETTTRRQIEIT